MPYLILVTSRRHVAQLRGKSVYVVSQVALVPLASQHEAQAAIHAEHAGKHQTDESLSESDAEHDSEDLALDLEGLEIGLGTTGNTEDGTIDPLVQVTEGRAEKTEARPATSIAEDVIGRRGQYGRFAERWFSKEGWGLDRQRMQGLRLDEEARATVIERRVSVAEGGLDGTEIVSNSGTGQDRAAIPIDRANAQAMLPKLLRTTKMLFGLSESFYFSYDCDITRRLGSEIRNTELSLHKMVDPLVRSPEFSMFSTMLTLWQYFWNRHLASSFMAAGHSAFILPIMQGFVGQCTFSAIVSSKSFHGLARSKTESGEMIKTHDSSATNRDLQTAATRRDLLVTLISRRQTKRAGLRYLRRGIDEEGYCANTVETEQILSDPLWSPLTCTYSFTQTRGSIPLFFVQSPYSFKPAPVLQQSYETNHEAFKRHFSSMVKKYGCIQVASLIDKMGGEGSIGQEYEKHVHNTNDEGGIEGRKIDFEWFAFHEQW